MNKILLSLSLAFLAIIVHAQNEPAINTMPAFNGQSICDAAWINDYIALEDPQADPITFDSLDVTAPLTPGSITINNTMVTGAEYSFSIDINGPYMSGTSNITLYFSDDNFNIKVANLTITFTNFMTIYSGPTIFCSTDSPIDLTTFITSSGGQMPITYNATGTGTTGGGMFDPSLAGPGTFPINIEATSNWGCIFTAIPSITVNPTPSLVLNSTMDPSTCGGTDGQIDLDVSSGSAPFTLTYNPAGNIANYTTPITNLPQGTYNNFQVEDANGCIDTYPTSITLTDPNPMSYNVGADTTVCQGEEITLEVTAPFNNVSWDNGITNAVPFTATTTTTYTATITDPNNCVTSDDITVSVNPIAPYTFNSSSLSICDNFGVLDLNGQVNVTPGIFEGIGVINNTFNPIYLNGNGFTEIYHTYSNVNGCTRKDTMQLFVNQSPNLSFSITDANCGNFDGAIDATITGGLTPYNIYWNNGSITEDISNIQPSVYYMNVIDANGCMSMGAATVSSNSLSISATTTDVTCFGGNDGMIDLTVSGGTAPYQIEWLNDGVLTEDRNNVYAGTWDVYVIDANGCQASYSVVVNEPGPLTTIANYTNPSCGLSDGDILITTQGGFAPYTYIWYDDYNTTGSTIGTSANITNLNAGNYSVETIDANGCIFVDNIVLTEDPQAQIIVESITDATCATQGAIDISIQSTLPIVSTIWNTGATTEDISNLAAGTYSVDVTNNNGCTTTMQFHVENERPAVQEICMVGVDTATQTNRVVWEKPITTEISHFNIYRETSVAGQFNFVDSVLYADESFFVDSVAYPHMRSWRYKLTAVNTCGIESLKSPHHKTIHAVKNYGLNNQINISWDHYEGFTYSTYYIRRYTAENGWEQLPSQASTVTGYTDTPPFFTDLDYEISINPPSPCVSTKATSHNASRSNRSNNIAGPNGPGNEENTSSITENNNDLDVSLFPNPTNGIVNLVWNSNAVNSQYQITDISGKIVKQWNSSNQKEIVQLSDYANGLYFLNIKNENGRKEFKIIKN